MAGATKATRSKTPARVSDDIVGFDHQDLGLPEVDIAALPPRPAKRLHPFDAVAYRCKDLSNDRAWRLILRMLKSANYRGRELWDARDAIWARRRALLREEEGAPPDC